MEGDVAAFDAARGQRLQQRLVEMQSGGRRGDGAGVAWLISAGTLAAVVTLSFWLSLLR